MGTIKGIDQKTLSFQIRYIIVCDFLDEYNQLERAIRNVFENNISNLSSSTKQQLYFYYGGKIGTYIEYESHGIKINELNYSEEELFKQLSINQIIKIFKNNRCLEAFNFSIESIQRPVTVFPFYDCMIRLLNMRNKLAHEVSNLKFKDGDIIELLSPEQIIKQTSVYKGYKQDKIEMRGDRAEMSDFPLYLNTVAGGLDRRDQTIGGFSFVVKIYALPVVEIIG